MNFPNDSPVHLTFWKPPPFYDRNFRFWCFPRNCLLTFQQLCGDSSLLRHVHVPPVHLSSAKSFFVNSSLARQPSRSECVRCRFMTDSVSCKWQELSVTVKPCHSQAKGFIIITTVATCFIGICGSSQLDHLFWGLGRGKNILSCDILNISC